MNVLTHSFPRGSSSDLLGRMGSNMARRMIRRGHETVGYNRTAKPVTDLVKEGAIGASGLVDMRSKLDNPAIFWVMLPAGRPTEDTIAALGDIASEDRKSTRLNSSH